MNKWIVSSLRIGAMASVIYFGAYGPLIKEASADVVNPPSDAARPADSIIENDALGWLWVGMKTVTGDAFHGGSVDAGGTGSEGTYIFSGTGVKIFGVASTAIVCEGKYHRLGSMIIKIDGKQVSVAHLNVLSTDPNAMIYQVSGLSDGNHSLDIMVATGWGVVDYLTVQHAPPPASPALGPGTLFRLSAGNAPDKWLDYNSDTPVPGAEIVIFSAQPVNHSQVWRVVGLGNGRYRLSPQDKPDFALTVSNQSKYITGPGNLCKLYKYVGAAAQQWTFVPANPGYFHIVNCFDNNFLNVSDNKNADGQEVIEWPTQSEGSVVNDIWTFVPVVGAH